MNKKLLAVAVSAALVAPAAAMAGDVSVYGNAQVEVASYSEDSAGSGKDGVAIEDNARGRVGVKASEDLGGGLKAIAQFEWQVDTTDNNVGKCSTTATIDETVTGTDVNGDGDATDTAAKVGCSSSLSLSGRVSQVGLTGGFGTVVLGNLKSPYKYTGGVKYDPFVTTSLQARSNGGMSGKNLDPTGTGALGHHSFVSNLVAYASPKGPVTASIGYGAAENDGLVVADLKYSAGGVEAFVVYLDAGDRLVTTAAPNAEYSATKIGGQWKSGAHKVSGQYEMIDNGTDKPTVLFLGYQMKMGKNTFAAQYGQLNWDVNTIDDTTYMALGVIHKMSKMTRVFAGYRDTSDVESVVTVGLRKDFKS
ncbi:MAG TPA: porin [Gammaproteobacteria bacterium]|nr:porin [Gammaproteobacteria bacterium]